MGDDLGERVVVPSIMLRDPDRDVFLDDMTLASSRQQSVGKSVSWSGCPRRRQKPF